MCVTVLSLPEREANSAASLSDSRSCFAGVEDAESGMALWRGMRQERPSVNWRRHLLPLGFARRIDKLV